VKLNDLIGALAAEIERARPQLDRELDVLATLDADDDRFMVTLDEYSSLAQRMGEAAEMVGFPGLQAVCNHVLENTLALPMIAVSERGPIIKFLRDWPPLITYYLQNIADPTTAAGLVDHLVHAPYPLDEEQALKVMHMLGAMPLQLQKPGLGEGRSMRPVLATPEDVVLDLPPDIDKQLLEGFLQEAPEQVHYLVDLSRNMASGQGDSSDLVAARRMAHTLKGSGSIIGLKGLSSLAHHFEDILDHFEGEGGAVAKPAADTLLDAAYCLEQMVAYVCGTEDYPTQAQAVLQTVLDLANRIDRGESLEQPVSRPTAEIVNLPRAEPILTPGVNERVEQHVSVAKPELTPTTATRNASALRVSVKQVDELFRVSGEISVQTAAMEARIKDLAELTRALFEQNLRVQKRLFELETVVDVRALTMMRARTRRTDEAAFDPLEMDQYSELHSTAHALMEEAADARALTMKVEEGISQLTTVQTRQQRMAKDLQHLVIGTRMAEAGVLEPRLQRNVRSTCQATGKQAVLLLKGGESLIDGDMLHRLAEPLLHLLRNAVDHGIERPEERIAAGKDPTGHIELNYARQGQQVVLQCHDDGRGLDLPAIRNRAIERGLISADQVLSGDDVARLILMPGFSTRDTVSEVSGRGIGLDVVRDWVSSMNGTIRVTTSEGKGCSIELRFPASLSTMQSLIVEVSGQRFALPSLQIEQAVPRGVGNFERVGEKLVYRHGKRVLPAIPLAEPTGLQVDSNKSLDEYDAVIVRLDNKVHALAVDRLIDSRELLVKNPGSYARHVRGVLGLSILGDGSVAVNLDLMQLIGNEGIQRRGQSKRTTAAQNAPQKALPAILIVDDALSVRTSLLQLVQDAGFRAQAARDGIDAIDTLSSFNPDVILTDLEMPNMNGIELTTHIRSRDDFKAMPVIMITSRSQEKHRRLAEQAGVNNYITKPYNDSDLLLTIRQALAA
jgi:chemotaxis protein histidine kinase CheA/ActR/RegA family two-component response regulator